MKSLQWLYDAVFGGPIRSEGELKEMIEKGGYPLPALLYFIPKGVSWKNLLARKRAKGGVIRKQGNEKLLHLPPAGSFCFVPAREEARSLSYFAGDVPGLIWAMQQAILVQRQDDLAAWDEGGLAKPLTQQDEVEAFALALNEVRRSGAAGGALEVWIRVVLLRHQGQINAIRLRLIEFLTALTRGSDANLAYATSMLIRGIYAEHSLVELKGYAARIVQELAPLLAGRGRMHFDSVHPVLLKAFPYMEGHYTEKVGLAEVAAACHVSDAHLARIFKQETGQTVVGYLQRLRVQRACELLATTSLPLLQVSMDSGFDSVEHFHRIFRRQCGITPRAYRLAHR